MFLSQSFDKPLDSLILIFVRYLNICLIKFLQRHSLWILSGEECSWKVLLGKPVCIKLDFLVHLSIYSALKACVACTEEFCPNTTRLFLV